MKKNSNTNLTDCLASETPEQKVIASLLTPPVTDDKHHILIITDSDEQLVRIRAALRADDTEITCATSSEDMCRGCCGRQDLVVVDVGPEQVAEILKSLRSCAGCASIPVLVEMSRISAAPELAGLLPLYRAMPCGFFDLITLARRRLARHPIEHKAQGVL